MKTASDSPVKMKLCGEQCEITDDTERPGLWTAEKSSSGTNPPDLKSSLSYKFALADTLFSLNCEYESSKFVQNVKKKVSLRRVLNVKAAVCDTAFCVSEFFFLKLKASRNVQH